MFIVIEGTDGSGKATQAKMLMEKLEAEGKKTFKTSFPMYDQPSCDLVKHYLNGDFGMDAMAINPYLAATFYAADRAASSPLWVPQILNTEMYSIFDRYVGSNAIHQAAKFETDDEKKEFFKWLVDLELNRFRLPQPDITFFLDMPVEETLAHMKNRALKSGEQKDIHESNSDFMERSRKTGLLAADYYHWEVINCGKRSLEDISQEIFQRVKEGS